MGLTCVKGTQIRKYQLTPLPQHVIISGGSRIKDKPVTTGWRTTLYPNLYHEANPFIVGGVGRMGPLVP